MARILFVAHATVGHTNPLACMALALKQQGHGVRFLVPHLNVPCPPFLAEPLRAALGIPEGLRRRGLEVETVRPTLSLMRVAGRLAKTEGYEELRTALDLFTTDVDHFARAVLRSMSRRPVDAVVMDFAFVGAGVAASKAGVPWIPVYHCGLLFRGPGIPPMGSGLPIHGPEDAAYRTMAAQEEDVLKTVLSRVNAVRLRHGVPALKEAPLRVPGSPWLNLVVTHPVMEAPRTGLGSACAFVGPCFSGRSGGQVSQDFPWDILRADACKVYVSLGTVFNNRPDVFRRILAALDHPRFQVVVSAGGAFDALRKGGVPANAHLFRSVPQVDVLPRMDLVVGHGGNNSTNETLACGKPLIILPVGGEQHDNGRRVEWLGVGTMLDIRQFTAAELGDAAVRLTGDEAVRQRLGGIARTISTTDGVAVSAALIEHVARTQAPLNLPDPFNRPVRPQDLPALLGASAEPSWPAVLP